MRMFKYVLLNTIYESFDVNAIECSRYDMSFNYFLGLTLEKTNSINPSTLCMFRRLRPQDKELLDLLIGKPVSIAVKKEVIKRRTKNR